jgi:glycosyltransferase involved in cell wall biosynthesis
MSISISIITPSFNQAPFLEDAIRSVLEQAYPGTEYLVIDGGSTDGSPGIIQRYAARLAYWVSEPDRGQVHAINKGLARASGEVVAFLNSDDVYLPGALAAVSEHFEGRPHSEWLCGDTLFFGVGHRTRYLQTRVPRSLGHLLCWEYKAPQPSMFWRRRAVGVGFDERWKYCFDHEFYVRLFLQGIGCERLPIPLAGYRLHPASKTVSQAQAFDREFDEIARAVEPSLPMWSRRWSAATRAVRRAYALAVEGRKSGAVGSLIVALATYPPAAARRPFWGTLRRVVSK